MPSKLGLGLMKNHFYSNVHSYLCLKIICGTGTPIGRPKQPSVPHGTAYSQEMNGMMFLFLLFLFAQREDTHIYASLSTVQICFL